MNRTHPTFAQQQGGRSLFSILTTLFVAFLAIFFILTQQTFFVLVGVVVTILACSGLYTIAKNEVWKMTIEGGVLSWSYPRWPRSKGSIDLESVKNMSINDGSGKVSIILTDGERLILSLVGYGFKLRDFMTSYFPHVNITYIESP